MNTYILNYSSKWLWLLILNSILLITACDYVQNKSSESNMSAQTTKFQYYINVGYPDGYDMTYERINSYFMDEKGKPIIYFGGWIGAGGGWGTGAQNTSVSEENVVPASFKVRWFSPTENQFWEGEFKLPQQELYQMFKDGYVNLFNPNKKGTYSKFNINVAPGGFVVLWLGGGAQTIQVGEFQAKKIEMDWQEFARNALGASWSKDPREQFVREVTNGEQIPDRVRQEIKTGTLPVDSAPWKLLQHKYLWRMQLSAPFELRDFRAWYVNAESLYTYADSVNDYQNRAVPYKIFFTFQKTDQQIDQITLILDKDKTIAAYKKLGTSQKDKLDLYLKISEDMSRADLYLRNKEEEIELDIKDVYLDDL